VFLKPLVHLLHNGTVQGEHAGRVYVKGYVKVETEFHVHAAEVVELIHRLKFTRVTSVQTACFSFCEINTCHYSLTHVCIMRILLILVCFCICFLSIDVLCAFDIVQFISKNS